MSEGQAMTSLQQQATLIRTLIIRHKTNRVLNDSPLLSVFLLKQLPGAQRDKDDIEDDEGHGAAMLSVKSHVKLAC